MKASLIIPTYNRGDVLCDTIEMALNQEYPYLEVIVVDQTASVDSKVRLYLDSVKSRIRYFQLATPNLPAARNLGIRAATGDIVVFIDDDVRIEQEYVSLHLRNFHDRSVGGAMGAIVDSFGDSAQRYVESLHPSFGIVNSPSTRSTSVNWIIGGNTSYRRHALLEAGLFDERFGGTGWCEDADLAIRVRHLGYKLLLDSRVKLIHLALPTGGCRNRDPIVAEATERDQVQLSVFHIIKNWRLFGSRMASQMFVEAYRRYALNRRVLRLGPRELLRRHRRFGGFVARSCRWLISFDRGRVRRFGQRLGVPLDR